MKIQDTIKAVETFHDAFGIKNNLNLRFYTRTYKPYVDRLFLCKKEIICIH